MLYLCEYFCLSLQEISLWHEAISVSNLDGSTASFCQLLSHFAHTERGWVDTETWRAGGKTCSRRVSALLCVCVSVSVSVCLCVCACERQHVCVCVSKTLYAYVCKSQISHSLWVTLLGVRKQSCVCCIINCSNYPRLSCFEHSGRETWAEG